jgi:hypothetical protein
MPGGAAPHSAGADNPSTMPAAMARSLPVGPLRRDGEDVERLRDGRAPPVSGR